MPEPKDEQRAQAEELEAEIEQLIHGGSPGGGSTLHEIAETKAAEYRKRRDQESGRPTEKADVGSEPEGTPGGTPAR